MNHALRWMAGVAAVGLLAVAVPGLGEASSARAQEAATKEARMNAPKPGETIPIFEAKDQFGKSQSFESLKGANGLVLLFVRSSDW